MLSPSTRSANDLAAAAAAVVGRLASSKTSDTTCAAGTPASSKRRAQRGDELLRAGQVEVAVDVEQVGAHGRRHLARASGRRLLSVNSAYSKGSSASDQARHWLAWKWPSLRVASQNSDKDGAASSDNACSIRLLTGAKPVSQAANTRGCVLSASTNCPIGPHRLIASPTFSVPSNTRRARALLGSRGMKKCRLRSSQGQLAIG